MQRLGVDGTLWLKPGAPLPLIDVGTGITPWAELLPSDDHGVRSGFVPDNTRLTGRIDSVTSQRPCANKAVCLTTRYACLTTRNEFCSP